MKFITRLATFAVFFLNTLLFSYGQNYTTSRVISLKEYIKELESRYDISFLYDSDLIEGIKIEVSTSNQTLESTLQELNEKTAFEFSKSNSTNIIVIPKVNGMNLRVCGNLLDEETKEPIVGGVIYINGKAELMADDKGNFTTYANLQENPTFTFSSFGFEPKTIPVNNFNGSGCLTIALTPAIHELDQIVITSYLSSGINYNLKNNSIEIKPRGMGLLPGETDSDVLSAIEALPGISTPDSRAGNLTIRGSSSDQTLMLFDNIPIYHNGHYFGTISPYNPSIVDNINVYRSAYMADKGGRVGGAIEISSKKTIPDSLLNSVSVSSTYASAYTQIPIIKNKLGICLAARTAYPYSFVSPKLKAINTMVYEQTEVDVKAQNSNRFTVAQNYYFNDFNAKVLAKVGNRGNLSFSMLNVSDNTSIVITDKNKFTTSPKGMYIHNIGYNTQYSHYWSERVSTTINATQSTYLQKFYDQQINQPDTLAINNTYKNELNDINLKAQTNIQSFGASSGNFGYDLHIHKQIYINYNFDYKISTINNVFNNTGHLHTLFANYSFSKKKFNFSAGLRGNYYTPTQKTYFEPRLMVNYFINDNLTLKSSAGIYNQFVLQIQGIDISNLGGIGSLLWVIANNDKIPVVVSKQGMTGAIFKKKSWVIDLEFFYKYIDNLSINNFRVSKTQTFVSPTPYYYGYSTCYGADLLVKKSFKNFDAWVSYSFNQSWMHFDSVQATAFESPWNQKNILDLVMSYKWRRWKFSTGWKYRSGLAALPKLRNNLLHGYAQQPTAPTPPPNPPSPGGPGPGPGGPGPGGPGSSGAPNGTITTSSESDPEYLEHYPAFHELDVSIVYNLDSRRKTWNCTIGLSLLNLYNRKNVVGQNLLTVPGGSIYANRNAIGFAPNLVVTFTW